MIVARSIRDLDLPRHVALGLVPTMGALHAGHAALFAAARPECDVLVASLGSLDVAGVSGEVRASCINGKLEAKDLSGRAQLSTINGRLDARFSHLSGSALELNSVNGSVKLTIPSDAKAEIEANTVSGDIENDFGLHVNRHRYVGRDMRGELAGGGARIKLENVNGRIEIRHAEDGRALSPIKDLGGRDRDRSPPTTRRCAMLLVGRPRHRDSRRSPRSGRVGRGILLVEGR